MHLTFLRADHLCTPIHFPTHTHSLSPFTRGENAFGPLVVYFFCCDSGRAHALDRKRGSSSWTSPLMRRTWHQLPCWFCFVRFLWLLWCWFEDWSPAVREAVAALGRAFGVAEASGLEDGRVLRSVFPQAVYFPSLLWGSFLGKKVGRDMLWPRTRSLSAACPPWVRFGHVSKLCLPSVSPGVRFDSASKPCPPCGRHVLACLPCVVPGRASLSAVCPPCL